MSVEPVRDGLCCVSRCRGECTITILEMDLCEKHKDQWFDIGDWRTAPQPFTLKPGWKYPKVTDKNKDGSLKYPPPVIDEAAKRGWSVPAPPPKARPPEPAKKEAVDPAKLRKKRVKKDDTQSQIFGSEEAA